jgi:hypothetical protein
MITTDEDGKGSLGQDNVDAIKEIIETGFKRYSKIPPEIRVDFSARSRASAINDFIRAEAQKVFYDASDINLYEIRGLFLVDFGDIQLRFKKLNKHLRPQNIPTNQTLAFMEQGVLPGIPVATKVVAGYQPDALFSSIEYMGILCFTDSRSCLWKIDLTKVFASPIPLHQKESEEQSKRKEHVTPKKGAEHGAKRKKVI